MELLQALARDPAFLTALESAGTDNEKRQVIYARGFADVTLGDLAAAIEQCRRATGLFLADRALPGGPTVELRVYLGAWLTVLDSEGARGW